MRHQVAHRKLNRTTSHRLAMLGNMVTSLFEHESIRTTVPKAKEARRVAERMITLAKRGGVANQRRAARTVRNRKVLHKVFGELKERFASRPGGYSRIVQIGFRHGDAAPLALLELVDRPDQAKKRVKPKSERKSQREPATKEE